MTFHRPSSSKLPEDQSSKTPSGKTVPMAMSMMVDSMVRMIQKANTQNTDSEPEEFFNNIDVN